MNMKSSPCAAWLAVLLISGLGIMGCSEADVPFSPEAESTETDPVVGIFTLVATALVEQRESPLAGVSMHGNYAYVGGMSTGYNTTANIGVRIVDVSDPTNPQLVGRIPLRDRGTRDDHSHGDAVATHIASGAFQGDVAIVLYGVPDDNRNPQPYGLWDVTDPSNPTFLSVLNLGNSSHAIEAGSLGDKPYDATAVAGNYVYAIYNKSQTNGGNPFARTGFDDHLAVVDISDPGNPVVVGDWQDDPGAWLAGVSLNESATRAYVTGFTGSTERSPDGGWVGNGYLFVLDIQNPSQPTELGRYVFPVSNADVSIARPTSDDALVVLADHSWDGGKCGILHILDTSNPAEISEISSFALPASRGNCSTIATDVAIRGNLVFSTWLRGGVRAIDISDPANPVEVGSFVDNRNFSDIALLGDDYVVATHVWDAGMVILRANSP